MKLKKVKKTYYRLEGEWILYHGEGSEPTLTMQLGNNTAGCVTLDQARAIHAELTELFAMLDEKV